jgi:hypothetical protein
VIGVMPDLIKELRVLSPFGRGKIACPPGVETETA